MMQHLLALGYDVFKEITGSSEIDLIAYKDQQFVRVQVKTCSLNKDGLATFEACKQHDSKSPFVGDEFDIMALYVVERNEVLFVTMVKLLEYKRGMSIRFEESKTKFCTSNFASDYRHFPTN